MFHLRTVQTSVISLGLGLALLSHPSAGQVNGSGYVPPGFVLAFHDEFDGTGLDRSIWYTRYIYAGGTLDRLNDEQQVYRDNDNHLISDGTLKLTAYKVREDPSGINYESGMIRSHYTRKYGYFEARVWMPGGRGVFPAWPTFFSIWRSVAPAGRGATASMTPLSRRRSRSTTSASIAEPTCPTANPSMEIDDQKPGGLAVRSWDLHLNR